MDPSLLTLIIFLAVTSAAATVLFLMRDLSGRRAAKTDATTTELDLSTLVPGKDVAPVDNSWLGRLGSESGYGLTSETIILLAILIALAVGGALFLWRDDPLAATTGAILGVVVVFGTLSFLRARRIHAIREQLPDCMDLMARAVRAGESLDQAIALVGNSQLRPLAAEFRYCASQMKMGLSLESAIRRMVDRVPTVETRIMAMTLIVQRRRGGSLPTTLERLARVFRDRLSFFRQFRAATTLGRTSATLIALLALGLDIFMIFGNSDYAQRLVNTPVGQTILVGSLCLQVLGIVWIWWLFRSRY